MVVAMVADKPDIYHEYSHGVERSSYAGRSIATGNEAVDTTLRTEANLPKRGSRRPAVRVSTAFSCFLCDDWT